MKFLNREKFLETVNQWVRDGSNIESVWSNIFGEGVNLIGKDGCKENLVFYADKIDFDNDLENFTGDEPLSMVLRLFPITFRRELDWWVDTGRGLGGPFKSETAANDWVKTIRAREAEVKRNHEL